MVLETLWLLLAAVLAAGPPAAALNKCCPDGFGLNRELKGCIPSSNSSGVFQTHRLSYQKRPDSGGPINMPCPFEESDALVMGSVDMDFKVNVDVMELWPENVRGVQKFVEDEFCLDEVHTDRGYWIAFTCPCISGVCIRTCCAPAKMLQISSDGVIRNECVAAPSVGKWQSWSPLNFTEKSPNGYFTLEELPKCTKTNAFHFETLQIRANGSTTLSFHENGKFESVIPEPEDLKTSCIGILGAVDNETGELNVTQVMLECHLHDEGHGRNTLRTVIYVVLFVVGAVFLLATIVVHLALPVLTKGVRGKGLVAHCACMFVAHIALIVVNLQGSTLPDVPCSILAYLIQYTLLAGFFWLNVLCINISMTFRSLQSMVPRGMLSERKQFAWYTVYAFAIPFFIFIATITTNSVYHSHNHQDYSIFLPDPKIGERSCWFDKDSPAILVFFYGPIGILLLVNLVLFIFTTFKIYRLSRAAHMINQNDNSQRHNLEHKRFVLFLKLFGLMGIPWVFEIISWAVGGHDGYWYLPDAVNILRSVFIFTTFCWKRKVWMLLCEKYPNIKKIVLMARREENSKEGDVRSNESYAETMRGVSMETVALE